MKQFFLVTFVLCLFLPASYASWQNPVFLSELNDYQNGYPARGGMVTNDEKVLVFFRQTPTKSAALWEAHRNPETNIFEQQRQLSELKYGGAEVYGSWISDDKLRLYYASSDPGSLGWSVRPIWMAIRNNPDEPWQSGVDYMELRYQVRRY